MLQTMMEQIFGQMPEEFQVETLEFRDLRWECDCCEERLEQVRQSVENGITLCYAAEGIYPESLEHLTGSYGVVYDESRYIVHYERFAANVRPTVTVIRREN